MSRYEVNSMMLVTLILLQSFIDFIHCFDLFPKKKIPSRDYTPIQPLDP